MTSISPEISVIMHLIIFAYGLLIIFLVWGWYKVKGQRLEDGPQEHSYSVLIPFRNEKDTLPLLLSSLEGQNFSKGLQKILFVNDHSDVPSVEIIKNYSGHLPVELIDLGPQEKGKKDALKKAWSRLDTGYIVQLDADVFLHDKWAESISPLIGKADLCILPIEFEYKSIWQAISSLEFMALSMTTFGSAGLGKAILANGAHLIYKKEGLSDLAASNSWTKTASGDDMKLVEHFSKTGKVKAFLRPWLKVSTRSATTLKELFTQRLRWAGKTRVNGTITSLLAGLFAILVNVLFAISLVQIFKGYSAPVPLFHVFASSKVFLDIFFLWPALSYFRKRSLILFYPILAIAYPFYVLLILILSFKKTSAWKEREIKIN
ncbi:MAG: glycosyltransferase [Flavobacteriales bacterium]|nr:glycosyltransferase [Flavobacteriales bacterium]